MTTDPLQDIEFAPIPKWPKTVGILSVCWGGLGLLCNGCGAAGILMQSTFLKSAEEQLGPMPDVMKPPPAQIGLIAIGVVWTILLIIAGILLISRKQISITLHLIYAIGGILMGLIAAFVGIRQNLAIAQWVQSNPTDKWAQNANPVLGWVFLAIGLVLGLAWPIFCAAWFGAKRKADLGGTAMSEIV
jgi:hypothetical protein